MKHFKNLHLWPFFKYRFICSMINQCSESSLIVGRHPAPLCDFVRFCFSSVTFTFFVIPFDDHFHFLCELLLFFDHFHEANILPFQFCWGFPFNMQQFQVLIHNLHFSLLGFAACRSNELLCLQCDVHFLPSVATCDSQLTQIRQA